MVTDCNQAYSDKGSGCSLQECCRGIDIDADEISRLGHPVKERRLAMLGETVSGILDRS